MSPTTCARFNLLGYAKWLDESLEITDKNDYYPFGINHIGGSKSLLGGYKNYKFLGEELQETGFYDLNARFYIPDIVIFGQHDPLSEKTMQPYAYGYSNPIRYGDPTGLSGNDFVERKDGSIYWDNKANNQATTKAGDTYLGKNLSFTFNSYIGPNYDGPLGSLPEGNKLTTTINLSASENSAGELTGLSATKITEMGKTFGIFEGRDYYPGEGGSNNYFTKSGMSTSSSLGIHS
jgi:RHS repeat-associated protein